MPGTSGTVRGGPSRPTCARRWTGSPGTPRAAGAIGATGKQWNQWLTYAIGLRSRDGQRLGVNPSARSRDRIAAVVALARVQSGALPTRAFVCATVVWAGYQNGKGDVTYSPPDRDQTRCTTLDGLELAESSAAWANRDDWEAADAFGGAVFDRYDVHVDLYGTYHLEFRP